MTLDGRGVFLPASFVSTLAFRKLRAALPEASTAEVAGSLAIFLDALCRERPDGRFADLPSSDLDLLAEWPREDASFGEGLRRAGLVGEDGRLVSWLGEGPEPPPRGGGRRLGGEAAERRRRRAKEAREKRKAREVETQRALLDALDLVTTTLDAVMRVGGVARLDDEPARGVAPHETDDESRLGDDADEREKSEKSTRESEKSIPERVITASRPKPAVAGRSGPKPLRGASAGEGGLPPLTSNTVTTGRGNPSSEEGFFLEERDSPEEESLSASLGEGPRAREARGEADDALADEAGATSLDPPAGTSAQVSGRPKALIAKRRRTRRRGARESLPLFGEEERRASDAEGEPEEAQARAEGSDCAKDAPLSRTDALQAGDGGGWRRRWRSGWRGRYVALLEERIGPLRAGPTWRQARTAEAALSVLDEGEREAAIEAYFSLGGPGIERSSWSLSLLPSAMVEIQAALNRSSGKAPALGASSSESSRVSPLSGASAASSQLGLLPMEVSRDAPPAGARASSRPSLEGSREETAVAGPPPLELLAPEDAGLWGRVLSHLRPKVERGFEEWFEGTQAIGETEEILYVRPNLDLFSPWLRENFGKELDEASALAGTTKRVEFLSRKDEARAVVRSRDGGGVLDREDSPSLARAAG